MSSSSPHQARPQSSLPVGSPAVRGPGGPGGGPMGRRIEKARDPKGTLRRLAAYLRPYALAIYGVLVLVLVSTILSLAAPYLLGQAIDQLKDRPALLRSVLLMGGAYAGSWIADVAVGLIMASIAQNGLRGLRRDLFAHVQTLSLGFFDRHSHGDLMSRLTNDIDAISHALAMNVTQIISGSLTLVGILILMFLLNFWLAVGSLAVLPLMLLLSVAIGRRTRQGFRGLQSEMGQLNGMMEETLSGQRVVVAFGHEKATNANFDQINERVCQIGSRAQIYSFLIPPLMGILSNTNITIVAGLGGWLTLQGMATVGTIATFITYSRRFAQPLRQLADLYNTIQSALAGAERVFDIIDIKPEINDAPDAIALDNIVGDVVFDHVDFEYVPNVPVLQDVSLHAKPGQTIALVGPTGAGKTTVVNLLSRFYDIQGGAILVDGHDIRKVQKDSLRRQLGTVLQDTYLFSDTVMENIRYGRLDATDEECIAAAQLANADQFIRRLPQGYQTRLSERASNLSQGQRQLVAIARAVLANPRILVLDEATSSVDTRTEAHIQEALLRMMEGRTAFVIAHRLSTIRNADEVLVINDGRIIERGTHESLLEQRGFYYNLYISQFRGAVTELTSEPAAPLVAASE